MVHLIVDGVLDSIKFGGIYFIDQETGTQRG